MRLAGLWIGLGVIFAVQTAWADGPARAGEHWDDSHMRSRHRSVLSTRTQPPELRGADRYDRIQNAPAETPRLRVPETLETASQREWQPGGRRTSSSQANAPRSSLPNLTAGRYEGSHGSTSSGSSSLRTGSVRTTSSR